MSANGINFYQNYHKLEKIMNEQIIKMTNTSEFINFIGEMVNIYIDHLEIQREYVKQWFDHNGFTNRDELVNVAKNAISNEDKVDQLDDSLYDIADELSTQQQSLILVKATMKELHSVLKEL